MSPFCVVEALDPVEDGSSCLIFRSEGDAVYGVDLERRKEALYYCVILVFSFSAHAAREQ